MQFLFVFLKNPTSYFELPLFWIAFGGPAYEEPHLILESPCSKIYFGDERHNLMTLIPHGKIPDSIMVNPYLKLQTLCLSSKPCGFHNIYIYKSIYIADMP